MGWILSAILRRRFKSGGGGGGGGPLHRAFHGINFPFTGVFCCARSDALFIPFRSLICLFCFVFSFFFFFFAEIHLRARRYHHKARIGRAPFERGINKTVSNRINGSGKGSGKSIFDRVQLGISHEDLVENNRSVFDEWIYSTLLY